MVCIRWFNIFWLYGVVFFVFGFVLIVFINIVFGKKKFLIFDFDKKFKNLKNNVILNSVR